MGNCSSQTTISAESQKNTPPNRTHKFQPFICLADFLDSSERRDNNLRFYKLPQLLQVVVAKWSVFESLPSVCGPIARFCLTHLPILVRTRSFFFPHPSAQYHLFLNELDTFVSVFSLPTRSILLAKVKLGLVGRISGNTDQPVFSTFS